MKNTRFGLILVLTIFMFHCSGESESSQKMESAETNAVEPGIAQSPLPESESKQALDDFESRARSQAFSGNDQDFEIATPYQKIEGRWLEYSVSVTIETEDFLRTRADLFKIAENYGFLKQSRFYTDSGSTSMGLSMRVSSSKLNQVLTEINDTGKLISESVDVTDHTGDVYKQQLKATLLAKRTARRAAKALRTAKNPVQMENLISQSEDHELENQYQKWYLKDRVDYAEVHVTVVGPERPQEIQVPMYTNALVAVVNFALSLFYLVLYLIPLWILIAILWFFRRKLPFTKRFFK